MNFKMSLFEIECFWFVFFVESLVPCCWPDCGDNIPEIQKQLQSIPIAIHFLSCIIRPPFEAVEQVFTTEYLHGRIRLRKTKLNKCSLFIKVNTVMMSSACITASAWVFAVFTYIKHFTQITRPCPMKDKSAA